MKLLQSINEITFPCCSFLFLFLIDVPDKLIISFELDDGDRVPLAWVSYQCNKEDYIIKRKCAIESKLNSQNKKT